VNNTALSALRSPAACVLELFPVGKPPKGHLSAEPIKMAIEVLVAYLCLRTQITRTGGQSLSSCGMMKVASMYLAFASQMRALTLNPEDPILTTAAAGLNARARPVAMSL
jgi:hypothetical protein